MAIIKFWRTCFIAVLSAVGAGAMAAEDPAAQLRAAAAQGETARVRELLARGAPLEARDAQGNTACLLYTSPSPRDLSTSRMPSSA